MDRGGPDVGTSTKGRLRRNLVVRPPPGQGPESTHCGPSGSVQRCRQNHVTVPKIGAHPPDRSVRFVLSLPARLYPRSERRPHGSWRLVNHNPTSAEHTLTG
jgi:hypothetical protein